MAVMTRTRWLWIAIPIFLAYVVMRGAQRGNDFKYPYNVARHVWQTGRLAVAAQPRYPVSFHVLLAPLASLPIGLAAAAWAVLSFGAIAALPRIFERLGGLPPRRQVLGWVVVLPSFVDALVLGQSDPINLFLVSCGLLAVKEGRSLAGTGLVGLAGMIKFLPILFWTTIVSRRRSWGVWGGMALATLLGVGLIVAAVGWGPGVAGVLEQWALIRDREKPWHLVARGSDLRPNNESLPIVLARTFGDLGASRPRDGISLARWPLDRIWMAWAGVVSLLALVWLASIPRANALPPPRAWLGMFALTAVVMLAVTPICWHHYFLWLLPATLFLVDRPRLLIASAVLSIVGTAFGAARSLGIHMGLALGLFFVVAYELRRPALEGTPIEEPVHSA